MFQHIEQSHIDNSAKKVQSISRGMRSEVKDKIKALTGYFHDNPKWELVCQRWEEMLLDAAAKDDEGMELHASVMSLMSTMFSIGFEEGLQSYADKAVMKLLKESNA